MTESLTESFATVNFANNFFWSQGWRKGKNEKSFPSECEHFNYVLWNFIVPTGGKMFHRYKAIRRYDGTMFNSECKNRKYDPVYGLKIPFLQKIDNVKTMANVKRIQTSFIVKAWWCVVRGKHHMKSNLAIIRKFHLPTTF